MTLARALADAGAASPDGLAVIETEWREFVPLPDTDHSVVQEIIERMLNNLIRIGTATDDQTSMNFIYSHWTFPLWPLDLSYDSSYPSMDDLRDARTKYIRRLQHTAAQRDPPPAISRETVEAMDKAYVAWHQDTVEYDRKAFPHRQGPGPHFRCSSEFAAWNRLPSYARLKAKLGELDTDARIALLALAYFSRDRVPNWPQAFKHATKMAGHLDDDYQVGLGSHWRSGLDRWEAGPPLFHVGRFFHH
ncbi:MAG: hypothetical protein OXC69_06225 [Candidatus Tectomicrobia bacterium]|nr:hypothetical protein [Candidatus Tectomicrobia bacterium]